MNIYAKILLIIYRAGWLKSSFNYRKPSKNAHRLYYVETGYHISGKGKIEIKNTKNNIIPKPYKEENGGRLIIS